MSETGSITKPIQDALTNAGYFCMRLNSGTAKKGKYYIRLCPAGTADLIAFLPNRVLWVETKEPRDLNRKGSTATAQGAFRERVEALGHQYVRATCLDDVLRVI